MTWVRQKDIDINISTADNVVADFTSYYRHTDGRFIAFSYHVIRTEREGNPTMPCVYSVECWSEERMNEDDDGGAFHKLDPPDCRWFVEPHHAFRVARKHADADESSMLNEIERLVIAL